MSFPRRDLPPSYSTLDLSPEDVANKPSAPHIDLLPKYSTLDLSSEVDFISLAPPSDLPMSYTTLNVSPISPEAIIAVDVDQGTGTLIERSLEENHHSNQSSSLDTRSIFTMKVISIIFVQLVAVGLFYGIFIYHGIIITQEFMLIALAVTFVPINAMVCCKSMRQASLMNIVLLGIFTVGQSFLLGVAVSINGLKEVLRAAGIALGIILVLALFAFHTENDFTIMGEFLICVKVALLVFGINFMFITNNYFLYIYGCIGVPISCMFLICNIQLTMDGKHKYSISSEEYIFAALNVYLDIINLFVCILNFLMIIHK